MIANFRAFGVSSPKFGTIDGAGTGAGMFSGRAS
jgi:hypothetical protein